jgi:uncharacterized protein (DUF952 family)
MTDTIYKICPADVWQAATRDGVFKGSGIDLTDGYIHFSTADQVASTARLHFDGIEDLVLVSVRVEGLNLVWEEARGGELFPHLYEDLELCFVETVVPLILDSQGRHIFPQGITPL